MKIFFFLYIYLLEIRKMAWYCNNSLDCKELCKHTYVVSVYKQLYKLTQTGKNKHVEYEDDFHEFIAVTFTSVWSKERLSRERGSSERILCQMERRDECGFHSSEDELRIHAETNPKAHGRSLQNTCSDRRNVSPACQSLSRKLCPLFTWCLFLFFSLVSAHSLSFDLSLVRRDPDTCFHSKHSEEASPCNNTTVNTKGTRPISSSDSYGVSFCHIPPSLNASSPLKRNV